PRAAFHSTRAAPAGGAAGAVWAERMRGADLRSGLVAAVTAGDRVVGGVAGGAAGDVYGGDVPGEHSAGEADSGAGASGAGVCGAGTGDGAVRAGGAVRAAAGGAAVHGESGAWGAGNRVAERGERGVPAGADHDDGGDAAGDVAMD